MQTSLTTATTTTLEPLTPEEAARVQALKGSIQISDSGSILQFAVGTQSKIAGYADSILSQVRNKDAGEAGQALSGLLSNVRELDVGSLSEDGGLASIPLIGGIFSQVKRFLQRYEKVSVQIDRIGAELDKARMGLMKDIALLDNLFQKNVEQVRDLDLHIVAGGQILDEIRQVRIPELEAQASRSQDGLDAQKVQDARQFADRFEKKLHDLRLSRTIAIQTAPQIRLVQAGNQVLVEKIQSSILQTLPLWKSQMVLAISLLRQKKSLKLQSEVTDATNDLLRRNSEMLKQQTLEVAREGERGIVDLETLKKVNADLISTLEDTLRIQDEGRRKRQDAEGELVKIEGELKQKVLSLQTRG
ncbi:MAG: toxic anion resistance protein [Fibrobacteres bacterium]|nr:toxic anion resistance protein [Fibrobacterota bacterium]